MSELRSGKGEAIWRVHSGGELVIDAQVTVIFNGPCYRLDVKFRRTQANQQARFDRLVIVNDQTALFCNRFSPRIKPSGCEIRTYAPSAEGFARAAEGLTFLPNGLPKAMLAADSQLTMYDIRRQGDGTLIGTYQTDQESVKFVADPEFGYNVTFFENKERGNPEVFLRAEAAWKREAAVWHVTSINCEEQYPGTHTKYEFRYISFSPNCPVDESQFTMESLEPCEGCRIVDQRPGQETRIYSTRTSPHVASAKLDGMVNEMQSLQERADAERSVDRRGRSWVLYGVFAAISFCCAAFLGLRVVRSGGARRMGNA